MVAMAPGRRARPWFEHVYILVQHTLHAFAPTVRSYLSLQYARRMYALALLTYGRRQECARSAVPLLSVSLVYC